MSVHFKRGDRVRITARDHKLYGYVGRVTEANRYLVYIELEARADGTHEDGLLAVLFPPEVSYA